MAVTSPPVPRPARGEGPPAPRAQRPGTALVLALVAAVAYAVFAAGAIGLPEETWLQVGLLATGTLAAAAWLLSGHLAVRTSPDAWAGLALLAAFAAWCGIGLLWSVAPDAGWLWLNRSFAYVVAVLLGVAVGASSRRGTSRLALGLLAVAVAAAGYALAGKLLPGLADTAGGVSRLRAPLGDPAALGLLCALGAPLAMAVAAERELTGPRRAAALAGLYVLLLCLGLTYSRGAVAALVLAAGVLVWLGDVRARAVVALLLAAVTVAPALVLAFGDPALARDGVDRVARVDAGLVLLAVAAAGLGALLMAGFALSRLEGDRVRRGPLSARRTRTAVVAGLVVGLLVAGALAARGDGGVRGALDRAREDILETGGRPPTGPARLRSPNVGDRWAVWGEAAGAWSDRPVHGWGAGSFPVLHLRYRQAERPAATTRSAPMRLLAETGLIGLALALGAVFLLTRAAVDRVRRTPAGPQRELAVALMAGVAAWLAGALWDAGLETPGLAVPALVALGALAARRPETGVRPVGELTQGPEAAPGARVLDTDAALRPAPGLGARAGPPAGRIAALAGVALLLGVAAVAAALPARSRAKALAAQAASATPAGLSAAATDAQLAARLDPLSERGPLAAAGVDRRRARLLDARGHALEAVAREPSSVAAWAALARLAEASADRRGFVAAAGRAVALDPLGSEARALAERAARFAAPAGGSPTATGTPLTPLTVPVAPPAP